MDIVASGEEQVTLSDILSLASWNRTRSSEELQQFVSHRHESLPAFDDIDIL